MDALLYLTRRTFSNRLKKALKKPVTYIYIVLGGAYLVLLLAGWGILASNGGIDSVKWLVYILTVWVYLAICSNFISYAKLSHLQAEPSTFHFSGSYQPQEDSPIWSGEEFCDQPYHRCGDCAGRHHDLPSVCRESGIIVFCLVCM